MTAIFERPADLIGKEGTRLGPTEWLAIEQDRVDGFAEVTGDHQWIHVDVERAKAGPFGGTIAHGYLTMSLVNYFLPQLIEVRGFAHAVNVGADRLRFLNPVKVGSRIRGTGEIVSVEEVKGAIQSVVRVTVEIEGQDKPACVLDTISRYFPE
ncbi:MaoC domain protein dehydratase (plasmid) [Novosphingobium aromaticivorans DSM 12444]|uniref:MaoC domain protein dehydratase n=1 Tax=Novosphingobium aromaticivorans (strain ATCC 700278 / DSM 12444 / CCUG 56034 / CIP 105152 / NBRC 16084 / F199) TaxID=279238 RepID=A4XFB2_NOVAD|nr:MaoC family dehydratase [Novosphingobium aromaticivorans]ABP64623.1 MaoC domain protein dehydratase [Novosphingobium aromaticivorans DSM 12444]SCY92137.1 Acyl dehydratase [Novosphingobium aromaticivorans]